MPPHVICQPIKDAPKSVFQVGAEGHSGGVPVVAFRDTVPNNDSALLLLAPSRGVLTGLRYIIIY